MSGFCGVDSAGLARLGAALDAAADELGRRASELSCALSPVAGPGAAPGGPAGAVAFAARWCLAQRDDVRRRLAGFDDEPAGTAALVTFGAAALVAMAGAGPVTTVATWGRGAVAGPGAAGVAAWSLATTPQALADALRALRTGAAAPMPSLVPVLVPVSLAGNVATVVDPDAPVLDRVVAGVGAGADVAALYLVCTATPGAGWVVVGVVAGAVAAYQLWRARDDIGEWASASGDALDAAGQAADVGLDRAGDWYRGTSDGAAASIEAAGDDWADWLDHVAGDAGGGQGWELPGVGAVAGAAATGVRWGTGGWAATTRASGWAGATLADGVGDHMAAAGRRARAIGDWLDDALDSDGDGDGDDRTKRGRRLADR